MKATKYMKYLSKTVGKPKKLYAKKVFKKKMRRDSPFVRIDKDTKQSVYTSLLYNISKNKKVV